LKALGPEVVKGLRFVCSDMWKPYLKVNGEEPIMRRKALGNNNSGVNDIGSLPLFGAVRLWTVTWR
jgi:hypothetical protein